MSRAAIETTRRQTTRRRVVLLLGAVTLLVVALAQAGQAAAPVTATLVRATDLSTVVPPSPDPTGLAYLPAASLSIPGTFLLVDSEVEETVNGISHFAGASLWELGPAGGVLRTADLSKLTPTSLGLTNEPTGIALNPATGHLYITDDDTARVSDLDPGPDGFAGTADDTFTSFRAAPVGDRSPAGIAVDAAGQIFVADNLDANVYVYTAAGTPIRHFDVGALGVQAPEGIVARPETGTLLVLGHRNGVIAEISPDGALYRTIDVTATGMVNPSDLALAPASDGSGATRLYILDRGVDNNADPAAVDGRLLELTAPPADVPVSAPPRVSAGADQTVELPSTATLHGVVADDGDPTTLFATWTQVSGPAAAAIASPTNADTAVTLPAPGAYVLRLSATDGEWSRVDDVVLTARVPGTATSIDIPVAAGTDDAEERGLTATKPRGMHLTSTDLDLMNDVGAIPPVTMGAVGLRFAGIPVGPGQLVTNAYIQFTADRVGLDPTAFAIRAEALDDAATFASGAGNITTRPVTVATAPWTPPPWPAVGQSGVEQRTPDFAPVLQEIVDRPGWVSGNAIALVLTGSDAGGRTARSFESTGGGRAVLHVEWRPRTANRPPLVSIVRPQQNSAVLAGQPLDLAAIATDDEDGRLTAVVWSSDVGGLLGTGATLQTSSLPPGPNTITASVTDSGGLTTTATVRVVVNAIGPETTGQLLAAGDIASCGWPGDEQTAALLDGLAGPILTLGDNVYGDGTPQQFADCYEPTWGRHKARTFPVPGNHDYHTPGGAGYFAYFGGRAGDPTKGYYSFDLGGWHVVALNSEITMASGSPQEIWLRADLTAHPSACTLAYWHEPRFGSGVTHGSDTRSTAVWNDLYAAGVDVVLNGHEHKYERFAPQNPAGLLDPNGITEFIVGTGGSINGGYDVPVANSLVRDASSLGVMRLTLHPTSFDWEFLAVPGGTNHDAGGASCVGPGVAALAPRP